MDALKYITPKFFTTIRNYSKGQFLKDLIAGVIVAIIALPLSIALAIASGVNPEQGLYTAVVAGFFISFLGGSRVQIGGPTAAFVVIIYGIIAQYGMAGLTLATLMAGLMLIIMGLLRFGDLIKFIPKTITLGFTLGIAVGIVSGQIKDFLGLEMKSVPAEFLEKMIAYGEYLSSISWATLAIGILALLIQIFWPRLSQKIPGSLVAIIVTTAIVAFGHLPVKTIGDLYTIKAGLPSFTVPDLSFSLIRQMMSPAFTIAILAAIESLLSCVVSDGMIGGNHRSNAELIGQGVGNIMSALFGGIPATGAIARTAANVKNGGRTPVAGMVHAVVLLLILVVLMPCASWIPMPTIAAILFMVAYNMCQWRTFVRLTKTAPKSDIAVLVMTFFLTVIFDLVVAIEIGMLLSCLLFMKRMSDETGVRSWLYVEEVEEQKRKEQEARKAKKAGKELSVEEAQLLAAAAEDEEAAMKEQARLREIPRELAVYEITGPLFFGAADRINQIETREETKCLVLRMRAVPAVDSTAMNSMVALYERCQKNGVTLILSHVNEQPMHVMEKAGFVDMIGRDHFCPNIEAALDHADEVMGK
mgnify:CR=1 FL=1